MCTLSFCLQPHGYQLFFNRDEKRTRAIAQPPRYHQQYRAVFGVDPEGNGTWLACREDGLSLAILNYYQGVSQYEAAHYTSRGQLILSLLQQRNIAQAMHELAYTDYRPFQLVAFPASLTLHKPYIHRWIYDGQHVQYSQLTQPMITSSSVDIDVVTSHRLARFQQIHQHQAISENSLKQFHYSTDSVSHLGVKMVRDDAHTVSISHIGVDSTVVAFHYHDLINNQHVQQQLARHL